LKKLSVVMPEGNVPEAAREPGGEPAVPALLTRHEDAMKFFEERVARRRDSIGERVAEKVSDAVGWARANSLFQYPFVTACCGMEYMSAMSGRYDIARFGAEFPRFTPRQADLLMIVGTINIKQSPVLLRVYEQMCEPKWVMAFGVCASSGGFYDNYATLQGADRVIPVDVYVPGCPPRPEQVLDGLKILQEKIQAQRHAIHSVERAPELDKSGGLPQLGPSPTDPVRTAQNEAQRRKGFLDRMLRAK
jgi:NADH-quinone oxidoreductase subunit B